MSTADLARAVNDLGLDQSVAAALQHSVASEVAIEALPGNLVDPVQLFRLG